MLVGWLCFTSRRQRGHLETAPTFTLPCEGHEARFFTVPTENRTPGRCVAVHYTSAAPRQLNSNSEVNLSEKSVQDALRMLLFLYQNIVKTVCFYRNRPVHVILF